jgi:hypothetical protein
MRERRQELEMSQEHREGLGRFETANSEAAQDRVSAARLFGICTILKVSMSSMFESSPTARSRRAEWNIEEHSTAWSKGSMP